jgi:hypothetical protein
VSRQVRVMLARISQRIRGAESIPALADPSRRRCNWPSISSPQCRALAWRDTEDDAKRWDVWFTRSLLVQPEAWQATGHGSTGVQLHRHPYIGAFQAGVSVERQFSCIFPAHPRSLASVLIPRPAALGVLLRYAPCGFRLSENLCAKNAKRFSEPSEKDTPSALGAGHTRVASRKSVPRVIRANTTRRK